MATLPRRILVRFLARRQRSLHFQKTNLGRRDRLSHQPATGMKSSAIVVPQVGQIARCMGHDFDCRPPVPKLV